MALAKKSRKPTLFRRPTRVERFPIVSAILPDVVGYVHMQTPIAVTIPEAVRATGMSRSSLYEALKKGELTARKAGRRTLIPFAELEAYLGRLPTYQARA